MDGNSNPLFPSKSELSARALFASTAEERELAALLSRQTLPGRDEEHAWSVLERLFPPGSEAEKAMMQSPVGQIVQQILDAQPYENDPADFPVEYVEEFEQLISKPQPPPAAPAPATELEDLAARTSLAARLKHHGSEGPKIEKPKIELPPDDWGPGGGTIL
jgi:hypothetical protein